MPLAVVAADIVTGREIVFRSGLLWPAVLASMSIPGVYPAQRIGEYTLVDGGVLNPVPSNVPSEMGAHTTLAVKLSQGPASPPAEAAATEPEGRVPSALQVVLRSVELMQGKIVANTAAAATILIEPEFADAGGFWLRSSSEARRYIALGEQAAEAALPRIEAALPWLRR